MDIKELPAIKGCPVAILNKKWFGLRLYVDFVANHKPFWVWRWQVKKIKDFITD